jgi:hypothetical protein
MKKVIVLFVVFLLIPVFGFTQSIENLDYISPFNDGLATIQKDGQWAFINTEGDIVVDFRNDLVSTKSSKSSDIYYPIFSDGRCLIEQKKEGISFFGYIDTSGKTIIEPQFLNATNFSKGKAIALKLDKEIVARNKALGKDVVYYKYFEVTIDTTGVIEDYLTQKGVNIVLDKDYLRKPPQITSKQIGKNLYAIKHNNNTWAIINIKD